MLQCDDQTHHHGIDHIHLELVDNVTKGGAGKNSVLKCDDQAHRLGIDHICCNRLASAHHHDNRGEMTTKMTYQGYA